MNKFLKYISIWIISVLFLLEIMLRIFGLAAQTMPTQSIDGNYLFVPNQSGYWVRGGLGEITNYYEINKQGYNSIVDYEKLDPKNLNIALIGDSYIQGFQADVRNSIGRQLEQILGSKVKVHEYGRAGANVVDYALVYKEYIENKAYDYTFILVTDKDLKEYKASFMGRGKRVPKKTIGRQIYDEVYILRYLNINHGFGVHFNELISEGPESINRIHDKNQVKELNEESYLKKINIEAINKIPESAIFIYEGEKLNPYFIKNFNFEFKQIIHHKLPKNHGFDGHWNKNGRFNCAAAMAEFINENNSFLK